MEYIKEKVITMNELDKMTVLIEKGWTYDPITGIVRNSRGSISKNLALTKYQVITSSFLGTIFTVYAHRFAWFAHYGILPKNGLDHINGDRVDNRIENLRDVSHQINSHNRQNVRGYTYNPKTKKYKATIGINYKYIQLGNYDTKEEAINIYRLAKKICLFYLLTKNK